MRTWRTPEGEEKYTQARKSFNGECRICLIPKKEERGSFLIVPNEFPYDAVSAVNDMLVLREHRPRLSLDELIELDNLKKQLGEERFYDFLLENMPCKQTIPAHFHLHLMRLRPTGGE
jgi:hypothetical protein